MRRKFFGQRLGLFIGLFILGAGLWLGWIHHSQPIQTELLSIPNKTEQTLISRLYLPRQTVPPYPTLMVWHGVSCTKETMEPLAIELAQHGIAVLATDAGGFGESYDRPYSEEDNLLDARAIAAYVYAHPERFDPKRIGVGGHSMGGATALALAGEDSRIKTTINLGMTADINGFVPFNLLMGSGLYEQFHSPTMMRTMLQQGTEASAQSFQKYGDFAQGTARKLVISPTSDHLMEPFDPTLIHESIAWVKQVFSVPNFPQTLSSSTLLLTQFLLLLGSLMTTSYGVQGNAYVRRHHRWAIAGWLGILILIFSLGMLGYVPGRFVSNVILWSTIAIPLCNYAIVQPTQLTPFLRVTSLYALLIMSIYGLLALMIRLPELIAQPQFLLGFPQFVAQMPIALIYSRTHELRATFFSSYSERLVPNWSILLLGIPMFLEFFKPGIVLHKITNATQWLAQWLRQPFKIHWSQQPSRRSWYALGGLSLLFVLILYHQIQRGAWSIEFAIGGSKILIQMALIPAMMIIAVMRSPMWQAIEARFSQASLPHSIPTSSADSHP